jgi:hypothetical protein
MRKYGNIRWEQHTLETIEGGCGKRENQEKITNGY